MTVRCFMLLGGVSGTVFDYPTTLGMLGLRDQLVAAGFQVTVDPWGCGERLITISRCYAKRRR